MSFNVRGEHAKVDRELAFSVKGARPSRRNELRFDINVELPIEIRASRIVEAAELFTVVADFAAFVVHKIR